jgi:hypothetical protein
MRWFLSLSIALILVAAAYFADARFFAQDPMGPFWLYVFVASGAVAFMLRIVWSSQKNMWIFFAVLFFTMVLPLTAWPFLIQTSFLLYPFAALLGITAVLITSYLPQRPIPHHR